VNPLKLIASCGIAAALVTGVAFAADKDKSDKKAAAADAHAHAKVGEAAPAFTLKDTSGKDVSLSDFAGKVVVLEWMNPGCPVCREKVEGGAVAKMMADAKAINPDVVFLFVNSTAATADKPQESADYLKSNKVEATALIDGDGKVGHAYGARTTPHCFVIGADGKLAYDGAIDDKGSVNYVVGAVKALKDGKAPSPATTKPYGCSVKYRKG
jgi:peroxiredoxin